MSKIVKDTVIANEGYWHYMDLSVTYGPITTNSLRNRLFDVLTTGEVINRSQPPMIKD